MSDLDLAKLLFFSWMRVYRESIGSPISARDLESSWAADGSDRRLWTKAAKAVEDTLRSDTSDVTTTLTSNELHFLLALVGIRMTEAEAAESGNPQTSDMRRTEEFRRTVYNKLSQAIIDRDHQDS